jgi:hypothetical protein
MTGASANLIVTLPRTNRRPAGIVHASDGHVPKPDYGRTPPPIRA